MAHTEWLPGVQLRHSVPPVQFIHAFVRCLFIYAMHDGCLSIPCTLPVYPCHVRCLFIHTMYVACLSIPCTLPVYPCHVRCLFIYAMYIACLPIPCVMAVYPSNPVIYVVHLSCISLVNHATHQKVVSALLTVSFSVEWLQVSSKVILYIHLSSAGIHTALSAHMLHLKHTTSDDKCL